MSLPTNGKLRIGAWCVDPTAGRISRGEEVVRLEARTLRLLLDLADHAGAVVSIDDLLDRVWAGVIVTPDSVYQAVAALRRILGDDPKRPSYIATVPRLGYRMVAKVEPWAEAGLARRARRPGLMVLIGGLAAAAIAMAGGLTILGQTLAARHPAPIAVGVLPFLDLSDAMDDLPLADDVTEGLIDRLAKNPRLRTPGFRASFQLRGKHLSIAQAAAALHVAYAVEGSTRRSASGVRIAARLIRVDDGFVVWTENYDRPAADIPAVQAAIAAGVGGALAKAGR